MTQVPEYIRKAAASRRLAPCTVLGDVEVLCRKHSNAGLQAIVEQIDGTSEAAAEVLADQFLDADTREPIFTPEFLLDELSNDDALQLMKTWREINGLDDQAVELA